MATAQYFRAEDLLVRLHARYAPPTYAFFREIKEQVGYSNRRADAVAVAMWRSHGLAIHGFEIKTNRADWLRELKQPQKSDGLFRQCDHWWLVVGDTSILKDGELPKNWGLLVANGEGLKAQVKAPELEPDPLDREFMCEILRSCYAARRGPNNENFKAGHEQGFERGTQRMNDLMKNVKAFEDASGVRIADSWPSDIGRVGEIVKAIKDGTHHHERERMKYLLENARKVVTNLEQALQEVAG